jgi:hypothetical protein
MKARSAKGRLRPFRLACGLSVTALTCGVALTTPAMAAAVYPPPAIPVLSTSPGGSCSAAAPAVVGTGSVTLQAAVSDSGAPSGSLLRVVFRVYANGDRRDTFATNASMKVDTASGTTADLVLSQADLQNAVSEYGSDGQVSVTWTARAKVKASKGAGSPLSPRASCTFTYGPEADQDLTGDNIPDLLTVGNSTSGVAPGLWLAAGEGRHGTFNGTIKTAATDIAPDGPQDIGTASSWDGYQAIIGQFLGPGSNAVEAYDPSTGVAILLPGASNGTVNTSQGQNLTGVFDFQPYIDTSGDTNASPDDPLQLVNGYDVSHDNVDYPDQIGVFTDPTLGGFLAYFVNDDSDVGFDSAIGGAPYILSNATPDGTMDWSNWTITTAAAPAGATTTSGSPVLAEMYLWNSQTGALYLWELTSLANEVPGGFNINTFSYANATATLSYSQITVDPGTPTDAGWNTGSTLNTLQATQINGGTGLIDVTSTGQVQSWTVDIDGTTGTATIAQANAANSTQLLQTGG